MPIVSDRPSNDFLGVDKVRISSVTAAVNAGRSHAPVSFAPAVHRAQAFRAGCDSARSRRVVNPSFRFMSPPNGTAAIVFGPEDVFSAFTFFFEPDFFSFTSVIFSRVFPRFVEPTLDRLNQFAVDGGIGAASRRLAKFAVPASNSF